MSIYDYGDKGEFTQEDTIRILTNHVDRFIEEKKSLKKENDLLCAYVEGVKYWCESFYKLTLKGKLAKHFEGLPSPSVITFNNKPLQTIEGVYSWTTEYSKLAKKCSEFC